MKLKELPNTVIHCKSRSEYDKLMKIYEEGGWVWCSGGEKPTQWDGWCLDNDDFHSYSAKDGFSRYVEDAYNCTCLSFNEFLEKQGLYDCLCGCERIRESGSLPHNKLKFKVGDRVIYKHIRTVVIGIASSEKETARILISRLSSLSGFADEKYELIQGKYNGSGYWVSEEDLKYEESKDWYIGP